MMKNKGKTKAQLLSEVEELRNQVAELEAFVTTNNQTEEELRQTEEKYRLVVENANEGIVVTQDGKLRYANPITSHFTGHTVDELTSRPFVDFIHTDDQELVKGHYLRRLKGEKAPGTYIFRVINRDGNIKWIEIRSMIINWEDRPAALSFLRDITRRKQAEDALRNAHDELERRVEERTDELLQVNERLKQEVEERIRAEEELRDSEARFRNLLEYIPGLSIQGYGADGIVRYWNKASEDVYGYTAEEAIGKDLGDLIIPPDIKPHFRESLEKGAEATNSGELVPAGELMLLHKNGHLVPVHSIHTVVCLEEKPPLMFCIDVDLSERKRAEDALRKAHDELEMRVEERTAELVKLNKELREREAKLEEQSKHLEQVNAALNVLLNKREEDKSALEESVVVNVKELILPYLEKMKKSELQKDQKTLIIIIESHLKNIVSPFTAKLSTRFVKLTATEIKIANLVKDGTTNKEIASMLYLSENTVKNHRSKIRNKLGLKHKKINLRSYLRSLD